MFFEEVSGIFFNYLFDKSAQNSPHCLARFNEHVVPEPVGIGM